MARQFAVTWDYRCPFARNAHEALINGLKEGRDWDVRFWAFSLDQVHVEEGATPVWERGLDEQGMGGVRALLWGIAVRDAFPDHFLDFHIATFRARHDEGKKAEHTEAVDRWAVFGVPTVVEGDEAVFVRIMERGNVADWAQALDLVGSTRINEFKRTKIPR